jgi:hypothetical protein
MSRPPQISASIEIDAPSELVWAILTDFDRYPEWNPFNVGMATDFEMGSAVRMEVALTGSRTQRQTEYITTLVPGQKVCWSMNQTPAWLIGATRCQRLEPLDGGCTRYTSDDKITGVLTPLVMLIYGRAMQRGFESVCKALKRRAEELAAARRATA